MGSIPGRAIPKALKMVPVATCLVLSIIRQALAVLSLTTNIAHKKTRQWLFDIEHVVRVFLSRCTNKLDIHGNFSELLDLLIDQRAHY